MKFNRCFCVARKPIVRQLECNRHSLFQTKTLALYSVYLQNKSVKIPNFVKKFLSKYNSLSTAMFVEPTIVEISPDMLRVPSLTDNV